MNSNHKIYQLLDGFESQPRDVCGLPISERDSLIVSAILVSGSWVILCQYGDNIWKLDGFSNNVSNYKKHMDFTRVPPSFLEVTKAIVFCYMRRGRSGQRRPKGITVHKLFICAQPFLRYLESVGLTCLSAVTPTVCMNYVKYCRMYIQTRRSRGKQLKSGGLWDRFSVVEALYELSQYTDDPIPLHPWPDSSALAMAGLTGSVAYRNQNSKTPLIPDDVFCTLFEKSYELVQQGQNLLDLRDALAATEDKWKTENYHTINIKKNNYLNTHNWDGGLLKFKKAISNIRTASYVVLASTTGCRNHELANIQSGAHHRTEDDQGVTYHWMRSRSEKTDAGDHDWMIPEAAVRTLRLMERWAEPYQAMIGAEIAERQRTNSRDPEIINAQRHRHALFLGTVQTKRVQVRTMSCPAWGDALKEFAGDLGLKWSLASHQFRRKFANYAAHSKFGDLRYLREHYAHCTMDMSLGYAMDRDWGLHLDLELMDEIHMELKDIKHNIVETWLIDEPLAGGYGRSVKRWQRNAANLAMFKTHSAMVNSIAESTSIRSNGHAWCTADDNRCIGNTLEKTRCTDCNNAVIGPKHLAIYQRLYDSLKGLLTSTDIGEGGLQRVMRNLERCREVLTQISGHDPESI
jgi:hypothetical protein